MPGLGIGDYLSEQRAAQEANVDPKALRRISDSRLRGDIVQALNKRKSEREESQRREKEAQKEAASVSKDFDALDNLGLTAEQASELKSHHLARAGKGPDEVQRRASGEVTAESELLKNQAPGIPQSAPEIQRRPQQVNPYAGTGRFNQLAGAAQRSHDAYSQGLEDVADGQQAARDEARQNAEAQLAAQRDLDSNKMAAYDHQQQLVAEQQEREAQQEKEQQARWDNAQKSIDDAAFTAKYWNANPDDARQWLSTVNDANADDRDRAKAKRNLERAQEAGDNRGVGKKIMAAIGLALTAAAGGDTRTMAGLIQSQIEQDMQSQLSKRDNKQKSLRQTSGKLDALRERFRDEDMALKAYKMSEMQMAKLELEKLSVTAGSQEKQAALQQGIIDLDRELLQQTAAMVKDQYLADNQSLNTLSGIESQRQGVVSANRKANAELAASAGKGRELDIPGYTWTGTASKEKHKTVVKKVGATNKLKALIDDALVDVEKIGTEVLPTDKAKAMQSKAAQIKLALKEAGALGALDKGSQDFLDEMVGGSFTGIRTGAVKSRLKAITDQAQLGLDAEVGAYGLTRTSKAKASKYGGTYVE